VCPDGDFQAGYSATEGAIGQLEALRPASGRFHCCRTPGSVGCLPQRPVELPFIGGIPV
jgi:hypothetical protein